VNVTPELLQEALRIAVARTMRTLGPITTAAERQALLLRTREVLHEVLSGYFVYDAATGLYWLTGQQAGMVAELTEQEVTGDAVAPFTCELDPDVSLNKLRFKLRQVGPFQFESFEASAADATGSCNLSSGCSPGHPDDAAGAAAGGPGDVHPDDRSDAVAARGTLRGVRVCAAGAPRLAPKRQANWRLLD